RFVRGRDLDAPVRVVAGARRAAERVVVALACPAAALRRAVARHVAGLLGAVALAHHLLHLLGHALHAALQPFERAALRIDRLAFLPLAELPFRLAHRLLGIREPLLALHAHAAHAPLQLLQPLAQGLLTPPEVALLPLLALAV